LVGERKERERVQGSHGVRWRVRARTGAVGSLLCSSAYVFVWLFRSGDSLRHARGSGLGF
ncbi:unnamed protein product, partial [Brassica rapa subsp. narinosa]